MSAATAAADAPSAWGRFLVVARPYWTGDRKRVAWAVLVGLIALMLLDTQLAVMVNDKTGELTSALSARDADRFWAAVRGMLLVVGIAVPVYAFYYASRDAYANDWRRWLTRRFLDAYLSDRAYFRLAGVDNPDQRIAEDVNTFTGRSLNFLLILLGSAMQLADAGGFPRGLCPGRHGAVHRPLRPAADPPELLAAQA
jgi:putative ATP-binding cassette transporter